MRIVSAQELGNWLATGQALETDARGPKVVALENGLFLKIFHTRRAPLLARLFPAAARFARNAALLKTLDVPAPAIDECFWVDPAGGLTGCTYRPLPGNSIEQLFRDSPECIPDLLPALAAFILKLHQHRVYFRSLHIGNIVLLPDGRFGLIDFLDLKRRTTPLSKRQVIRNFRHLTNHLKRRKLEDFPAEALIALYNERSRHKH